VVQLVWDTIGERYYEMGVDRGVLYVDGSGYSWNGLVSVEETPTGGEARPYYIDGVKYLNLSASEEFEAVISAFYSPVEFDQCDGVKSLAAGLTIGQQRRKSFGLSYRTKIGNDLAGSDHGYKIHIIYNALVAPTSRNYASIGDNPEVPLLAWPITTKPIKMPAGATYSAHVVVDSTKVTTLALNAIEQALYGTAGTNPRLPTPQELMNMIATSDEFVVTFIETGKYSVSGSSEAVDEASPGVYEISHDTGVIFIDPSTVQISSP
jgi:hypothetical protein